MYIKNVILPIIKYYPVLSQVTSKRNAVTFCQLTVMRAQAWQHCALCICACRYIIIVGIGALKHHKAVS